MDTQYIPVKILYTFVFLLLFSLRSYGQYYQQVVAADQSNNPSFDPTPVNTETAEAETLRIFPNPLKNVFTTELFLKHISDVQLSLTDISGKNTIHLLDTQLQPGKNQFVWNTSQYISSPGIYFLKCSINGMEKTYKLIEVSKRNQQE